MLNHPTLDRLRELGLDGMAKGFCDLAANPESRALEHAEWLGLLVEQEATLRQQKRFAARARAAKLRHAATVEDVDFRTPRGLDRALFLRLASGDWIREHRHCLITGPCGTGKSWLACALGDKACRDNLSVLYQRSSRLFASLALARGDGRYARLMRQLARVDLLILDDWGPEPLAAEQRRDLLEIVEDRGSVAAFRCRRRPGRSRPWRDGGERPRCGQDQSFKGRQFTAEVILWAVRWYLMFPISYRDLELMLAGPRRRGGPHDHLPLDPGLCRGVGEADPAAPADEQRLLAGGRDLRSGEGPLDVSVSGGGQPRPDDRLPALGEARCGGGEAVLPQGFGAAAYGEPAHHHRRQEPRLSESRRGDEGRRRAVAPLSAAPMQIPEQHCRTGPPAHQTSGPARARLRRLLDGSTNTGWL